MIPKTLAAYAVAGAALCAVLVGCEPESGETPQPSPGPAVTDQSAGDERLYETDLYLTAARAVAPELSAVPDADLVALGESVCGAFDRGVSTGEVAEAMTSDGALTGTQAGAVVGSATGSYGFCPEHGEVAQGGDNTASAVQ